MKPIRKPDTLSNSTLQLIFRKKKQKTKEKKNSLFGWWIRGFRIGKELLTYVQ
jgi:hypothetical protein